MMAGVVICAASASGNAFAQDASPADKEKALAVLETSKKGVLDATKGCPKRSPRTNGPSRNAPSTLRRRKISFSA
jgi:hypothetical protein